MIQELGSIRSRTIAIPLHTGLAFREKKNKGACSCCLMMISKPPTLPSEITLIYFLYRKCEGCTKKHPFTRSWLTYAQQYRLACHPLKHLNRGRFLLVRKNQECRFSSRSRIAWLVSYNILPFEHADSPTASSRVCTTSPSRNSRFLFLNV